MDGDWIPLADAIDAVSKVKAIPRGEAIPLTISLAKGAEVGSRIALEVNRSEGQPRRNVPMNEAHWRDLGTLDTDWIGTGNAEWMDGFAWRGIQIHAGDLAIVLGTKGGQSDPNLQPVAPPPVPPLLPPERQFVTLSHALTWIAFGVSMDSDQLHEVLNLNRYGEHDPQEGIKAAVAQLVELGRGERVAMQGKYRQSHRDQRLTLLTAPIEPVKFADFRQFNYLHDELRHGEGLTWWRTPQGVIDRLVHGGRSDSFIEVSVNRADLLREFGPKLAAAEVLARPAPERAFSRSDPAKLPPWWTVNQALAWIATRIPAFVEYVGNLETDEPSDHRRWIVHLLVEPNVDASEEAQSFVKSQSGHWQGGTAFGVAGRALLEQIRSGAVTPLALENGKGRPMGIAEFVGIGGSDTASDWLSLQPQPIFGSDEMMQAFPAVDLVAGGNVKGNVPANRQLNHEEIIKRAEEMREEQPGLSLGSAAASIRAELPPNPKTGKPRDQRGIERIIGHLWGKASQSPG